MKKELSALEIKYLIKEFQVLINSKVDSIIHPEKNELLIQFFIPSKGKKILRILPNFIYLTTEKKSVEKPTGFCLFLRKYLINSRLRKINQIKSERIIEFEFEVKDNKYILLIELFSKGNIILCKGDYEIISLLQSQKWKDRTLKPKIKYKTPPKKINFFKINDKDINQILKLNKSLIKKLAIDLGLGGVYSEEICLLTNIDKNKNKISDKELQNIEKAIKKITNQKIKANIIYKNKEILDIVPFPLQIYQSFISKKFKDYNSALDSIMTQLLKSEIKDKETKVHEKSIEKINKVIEKQTEKIEEIKNSIKENEKKAELIYNNFNLIKNILEELNKAKEKYEWKEIKDKLKGHKVIKEVNSKDKKIIIELK